MTDQKQALSVSQHNTPSFLADATSSLEKMEAYANMLIKSGLVPKHFYELDQYRNPQKDAQGNFKGNTAAVIMTIQHGLELGMSITQSLQQIVPVNGLMSLRGDAAKALIMRSNLCKEWKEEEVGTHGTDSFGIKITSVRTDGQTISRTFTVQDAKRAGLWIDDAAVAKNDKLRHSPWHKYQSRMLRYRALGFISRDLYGDVLQNMYTEDEARDIGEDNTTFVTQDGITARIDESRPSKLNEDAKGALSGGSTAAKPAKRSTPKPEPKKEELFEEAKVVETETVPTPAAETLPPPPSSGIVYTKAHLDEKSATELLKMVNEMLNINADEFLFAGERKSKRLIGWLRRIILANQDGTLDELLQKEFNISRADLYPSPQPEIKQEEPVAGEVTETIFSEPGEGGRTFGELMEIDKKRAELGVENQSILDFIAEQQLEYESLEAFYRNAPAQTIQVAFGI